MTAASPRVAVLASGGGTNLQAMFDAVQTGHPMQIVAVISDQPDAGALIRARAAGAPAFAVPRSRGMSRDTHEAHIVDVLRAAAADWVALAGYMRLVGPRLLDAFPGRVLNIHPSLLPAFPGLHAQAQAHAAGVRVSGATVHFVDQGMDTGPIIAQGVVPAHPTDTVDDLQARILTVEHQIYPLALRWAVEGRLRLVDTRAIVDLHPDEALVTHRFAGGGTG